MNHIHTTTQSNTADSNATQLNANMSTSTSIYIHYAFKYVKEPLVRTKLGDLLNGCEITKVTFIPRRNPTGRDYQSIRVNVDWNRSEESGEGNGDSERIRTALEDGKQIRVEYDTRGEFTKYWILVKHKDFTPSRPEFEVMEKTDSEATDGRVEITPEKEGTPDLYIHFSFPRVPEIVFRRTICALLPGVEIEDLVTFERKSRDGREYKSVRIITKGAHQEDDEAATRVVEALKDNRQVRVVYDTRGEVPRYWMVTRNRIFQRPKPEFQIVEEKDSEDSGATEGDAVATEGEAGESKE